MRSGFLVQQSGPKERQLARTDSASDAAAAALAAPPRAAAPAPAPTPEQAAAGLAECLQLLKGPSDERRFVGLLLVTKLLPPGDAEAVRQVHAAVGPTFLTRLLLPLRTSGSAAPQQQGGSGSAAAARRQQEAATCALALAVLSSFARVPELAGSEDILEKLPLLLNVVRAGGIAPLLAARHGGPAEGAAAGTAQPAGAAGAGVPEQGAGADEAAVQDALECAVAAARSGPEGAAVAADSGAVGAAVAALAACPPSATQRMSLALQLLTAVLADEARRAQLVAEDPSTVLHQLLPALAGVFALPAQQLNSSSKQQQQQGQEREAEELQRRLLAVQLEALHVLLLLLPLPQAALAAGSPLGRGARWPAQLRQGLGLLLRGRISAVQRHSALQLAAAVVDLAGAGWLLGGGGHDDRTASGGAGAAAAAAADAAVAGGDGEAFFQLVVEVAKVETSVLLHDALAPDVPVPLASAAAPAADDWRPPAPRHVRAPSEAGSSEAGDGDHAAGAALAADLADAGASEAPADVEPLVRVLSSEQDRKELEEQLRREHREVVAAQLQAPQPGEHMRRVDGLQIPTDMRWEGPSEASGARAARVLPSCFALLEACVEALAADTQRSEAADLGGGATAPALSPAVAQRALFSLQEAVEVVLQFIEQTVAETVAEAAAEEEGAGRAGGGDVRHVLLLAALRVLARFCAEAPDAFASRLRPVLPHLLPLRADWAPSGASGGQGEEEGAAVEHPAEGTVFLVPMLLQVTDPAYSSGSGSAAQACRERELWRDALAAPRVLRQLSRYARACAASCAPAVTTAVAAAADDALLYACQLLLNVLAPEEEPQGTGSSEEAAPAPARRRRALLAAGEPLPLLRELLHLAAMRPLLALHDCSPAEVLTAARLLCALAALCGLLAASVAEELHSSSGSSGADSLHLELSPEEQQRQLAEEEAEERLQAERRRRRQGLSREASLPSAEPPLPFLGPISGRLMLATCTDLLAGIQVAAQLALAGADLAGCSWQLAEARDAADEDPEFLQTELCQLLGAAAGAAAVLARHYPPFLAMCQEAAWLASKVAAVRSGTAACAGSDAPPQLALLLSTLAGLERG
ncbi:hypothetical protein ABPG75_005468 [Micractinium tetrahymenae]